jgi:uncharacterized protein YfaS (alpha-2-macroglobulin family)
MIKNRKRRITTFGKDVSISKRFQDETIYNVNLTVVNKGDPIDFIIDDIIPSGFTIIHDPFSEIAEDKIIDVGVFRQWKIKNLASGERFTVSFEIKGINSLKYTYLNVNKYRIKEENN